MFLNSRRNNRNFQNPRDCLKQEQDILERKLQSGKDQSKNIQEKPLARS
jgi:hypothetical protein